MDVFGKRFQHELEQMKKDVAKWQTSPELYLSPLLQPSQTDGDQGHRPRSSVDTIPLLDEKPASAVAATGADAVAAPNGMVVTEKK